MANVTAIEWTDVSWNPVHGCSKVSPGCAHCYAETLSRRYKQTLKPWTPANAAENVILKPHKLNEPLSKRKPFDKPCRVFVNSTSDLFHEEVPNEFIESVFVVMARAQKHTFQILTKRPERMRQWFADLDRRTIAGRYAFHYEDGDAAWDWLDGNWPLPNVWLGVSIENRRFVDRADVLRETPAAVRFISAEPLLGPLVNTARLRERTTICDCGQGEAAEHEICLDCGDDVPGCSCDLDLTDIDWLIVGGESGSGHRPMQDQWVRDLRDVCIGDGICAYCDHGIAGLEPCNASGCREGRTGGVAFFFKQRGGIRPKANGRILDGRTWDEMPRVAVAA